MAVIDLRDDPRVDMQMAQNIGQGLGAGFNAWMRGEYEKALVGIMNQAQADGKTPEETHDLILANAKAMKSKRGQEIAKLHFEEQTGTGRYDLRVLENQRLANEAKQGQIDYNKARAKYWNEGGAGAPGTGGTKALMTEHKNLIIHRDELQKQYDAEDNPEEEARLKGEIARFNKQIGGIAEQLWPTTAKPRAPGPPIGVDASVALGYPPQQPSGPDYPSVFNQSPQATPIAGQTPSTQQQPPSTAGNMGPPVTESIRSRLHFENVPYRQPEADVRGLPQAAPAAPQMAKPDQEEPQSQEQFEQTVSQMAKTDRAAAKSYYDKWVNKWQ